MLKRPLLRAATALTVAALFAACGDSASSPTAADPGVSASVTTTTTTDVAAVSADAAQEDVETFKVNRGAFGLATLDFERFFKFEACPWDATAKRFICAAKTRGPFTYSRSYAYVDGSGAEQSAYNATTTAGANFKWSLSGTITKDKWSGTMSRERDITLTGLLGANTTVTINGTGSTERQRTKFVKDSTGATSTDREYNMEATVAIKDVVTPALRLADNWPISGTITRNYTVKRLDASGNVTSTTTRTTVVTFNGTQFAKLMVNDKEFKLDLALGKATPVTP